MKEQREKEELQRKFDEERKNKEILLEAVWGYRNGRKTNLEKNCFLLTQENENKGEKLPNFLDEEESDDEVEQLCYGEKTTSWTDKRDLGDNEEIFWIRGKNEWVKKLIISNWNDLIKASNYSINKSEKLEDISFNIREKLNNSCEIISKSEEDWVEITCTNNTSKRNQDFIRSY